MPPDTSPLTAEVSQGAFVTIFTGILIGHVRTTRHGVTPVGRTLIPVTADQRSTGDTTPTVAAVFLGTDAPVVTGIVVVLEDTIPSSTITEVIGTDVAVRAILEGPRGTQSICAGVVYRTEISILARGVYRGDGATGLWATPIACARVPIIAFQHISRACSLTAHIVHGA